MKIHKIIFTILLIILFVIGSFLVFKDDRNCLEEIAEDYCKGKDLSYYGINIFPPMFFFCNVQEDAHDLERFVFTGEDISSCERIKFVRGRF